MSDLKSSWGVFPWRPEHGHQHIYPDDLSLAEKYLPSICVFECVANDGDYLTLKYKDLSLRVRPDLFNLVDEPVSKIGERVKVLNGSAAGKEGVVENLTWHFKNKEVLYSLKISGKVSSRDYTSLDIESVI